MSPAARRRNTWESREGSSVDPSPADVPEASEGDAVRAPDETAAITIRLDGVPIGKGRPRFGNGKTYTPDKTRAYEQALALKAMESMRGREVLTDALVVDVEAHMAVPASWSKAKRADALAGRIHPTSTPDCDNILKCLDALNGVVFLDDKQIVKATVWKHFHETPALFIWVEPRAA